MTSLSLQIQIVFVLGNILVKKVSLIIATLVVIVSMLGLTGCSGYSNGWAYPDNVQTISVKMFDTKSFRRDYEYTLSDAICKQIEVQTPYRIVADDNVADTQLSGYVNSMSGSVLSTDRESGSALEDEVRVSVTFTWKNLKTGEMIIDSKTVTGVASYAELMNQDYDYAANVAMNQAAVKIVESMETPW